MKNKVIKVGNKLYNKDSFVNHYVNKLDFLDDLVNNRHSHDKATEVFNTIKRMAVKQFNKEVKGTTLTDQQKDQLFVS